MNRPQTNLPDQSFALWLNDLQQLAEERDVAWLICSDGKGHRPSYDAGLSPADELDRFADMCEWRGCGCGG